MIYTWFYIFNTDEFDALGLASTTLSLNLEGIGQKDVQVTKGVTYGIKYDDVFLSLNLNDKNPFEFEDRAIYIDAKNNVWLGIKVAS